jgi:hypothetical protein
MKYIKNGGIIMRIDIKSFILGAIVGGCAIIYKASVAVAKDKTKKENINKEEA